VAKKSEFRNKNGERCSADVQIGKSLRVFHDPATASEGGRARRAGGINLFSTAAQSLVEFGALSFEQKLQWNASGARVATLSKVITLRQILYTPMTNFTAVFA
jgi:hypothetical protein